MTYADQLDGVLVVDDEPAHIQWLLDFLTSIGLKTTHVEHLQEAVELLRNTRYRYVIIDLNIPYEPAFAAALKGHGEEFLKYPGILVAREARNSGHNTYQVIVYSVHDSTEVRKYAEHIRFTYIIKGRPRELKAHIDDTITLTPHGWKSTLPPDGTR